MTRQFEDSGKLENPEDLQDVFHSFTFVSGLIKGWSHPSFRSSSDKSLLVISQYFQEIGHIPPPLSEVIMLPTESGLESEIHSDGNHMIHIF